MILAAIDIGSNAIRLLIMEATTQGDGEVDYTKLNFLRIPLRLGMDVFDKGMIGEAKTAEAISAMQVFAMLMKFYRVSHYRACATSAMRDAGNGVEVAEAIRAATGITVEIISGDQEASLLYDTHIAESQDHERPCLFVDVGGGSTELTLFASHEVVARHSFNIGTIRMLNATVPEAEMDRLKDFVKTHTRKSEDIKAIGTGGNINKLHSLARLKDTKPLSLILLKAFLSAMGKLSVEERMHLYQLRRDRADVIVPALQIFCSILRWADLEEIYVPKIGLADGLIKAQYLQYGPA